MGVLVLVEYFEQSYKNFKIFNGFELWVRSRFNAGYDQYRLSMFLQLHKIGLLKYFDFLEAFRSFAYVPLKEKITPGHSNL
jgi:hypothetical protein